MSFVQARLVNDRFCDPGLLLDMRFGRRALLFDLGDLASLSSREILRVSHIFVSHMHMDHFSGFDRLLRLNLYQPRRLEIVGPNGLVAGVEAKLRAYTWNLLGAHSVDFSILARDWMPGGFRRAGLFRARDAFERRAVDPDFAPGGVLEEPEFAVEAACLDHGIPSLAFAFQERLRVNVHKARLDKIGLPVGPWLTAAKRMIREGRTTEQIVLPALGRSVSLDDLIQAGAFQVAPGQRIAYAADLAFHQGNVERLAALARGADQLSIESAFLDEDRKLAAAKHHLTAKQAGIIARTAGVRRVTSFHFSARYRGREAELCRELETSFAAPSSVMAPPSDGAEHSLPEQQRPPA